MKITFKTIITFLSVLLLYFIPSFIFKADQEFYNELVKIEIPSFVFSIAWAIIFVLLSVFITWIIEKYRKNEDTKLKDNYKRIFVYLVINYFLVAAYTPVFFDAKNLFLAFIITILTFITVVFIIMEAFIIEKKSFWLLLFYLLWTCFATIDSIYIYLNN